MGVKWGARVVKNAGERGDEGGGGEKGGGEGKGIGRRHWGRHRWGRSVIL